MSTLASSPDARGLSGWLARAEAWLDDRGTPVWIIATILAFILFWPLGLALLAYMIWSKKMICTSRRHCRRAAGPGRPTGNSAFDNYCAETLARLEREQRDFEAFLQRLREARDKAEFDQFVAERARATARASDEAEADPAPSS